MPLVPPAPVKVRDWQRRYVRRLAWGDTAVVVASVAIAQLARFGPRSEALAGAESSYTLVSAVLVVLWLGFLAIFDTRDRRTVGEGTEEYRRIVDASMRLFGVIAIIALLARYDIARGYLLIALPVGLFGLCLARRCQRRWLLRRRTEGDYLSRVLVVGRPAAAVEMARTFDRHPDAGLQVVGVCVPGRTGAETVVVDGRHVPVLGDEHAVIAAIRATGADTVAVSATEHLGQDGMRELAWDLAEVDVDLVLAPGVVDVAGPRLKIRPLAGLPLLHVEEPQYEGAGRLGKNTFDLVAAAVMLALVTPVLAVAALAVTLTSRGPVLYCSERVGRNGQSFSMLKLRSMTDDADTRVVELAGHDEGSGPLFKIRRDPRVTRVGAVLRRFSIDELPQLVNVLRGQMSIVGPRPPLRSEVDTYTGSTHRRLLVKPGITGLWQVSGRSDLSWEDSVRLDLSYVENWSMITDALIVWRTVRAVLSSDGAY
ncbi:MAG: sugar transferase [Mycobacteriaceae bacterium]